MSSRKLRMSRMESGKEIPSKVEERLWETLELEGVAITRDPECRRGWKSKHRFHHVGRASTKMLVVIITVLTNVTCPTWDLSSI